MLGHERLTDITELAPPRADIACRPGAPRPDRAVLLDKTLPDPPRGMTLLARRVPIGLKPGVDQRVMRAELRRRVATPAIA